MEKLRMGVRFAGATRGCVVGALASLLSCCRGENPLSLSPPKWMNPQTAALGHSLTHSHPELLPWSLAPGWALRPHG